MSSVLDLLDEQEKKHASEGSAARYGCDDDNETRQAFQTVARPQPGSATSGSCRLETPKRALLKNDEEDDDFILDVVRERARCASIGFTLPNQGQEDGRILATGQEEATAQQPLPGAYATAPGNTPQRTSTLNYSNARSSMSTTETATSQGLLPPNGVDKVDVEKGTARDQKAQQSSDSYHEIAQMTRHDEADNVVDPLCNNENSLAVANLVVDDSEAPSELPMAQDYNPQASNERLHKTRQWKKATICTVITVLMLSVILLVSLVPTTTRSKPPQPLHGAQQQGAPSMNNTNLTQTKSFEDSVLDLLPEATIAAINTPKSAQSTAFQWLLEDYSLNNLTTQFYASNDHIIQRYALATLFFATTGEKWTFNDNWTDHNTSVCDWYNRPDYALNDTFFPIVDGYLIDMFPPTEPPPTTCDDNGLFQHLWVDQNNLVGYLPDELYLMTHLQTISIGLNQLHGPPLPSLIGKLTNLKGFVYFGHKDASVLPTELGLLTNLRALSSNFNNHIGSIPSEIWQLPKLDTLTFYANPQLEGTIPTEIGTMSRLRWVLLDECKLTGTIPTEVGLAKRLEVLHLDNNFLNGTIPTEVGLLTNTLSLDLGVNDLSGTIPTQLGALTSTTTLSLRSNNLSGTMVTEFGQLASLNFALNLEDNRLSGQIPSELGLLTSLGWLGLGNNSLTGKVPPELSALGHSLHTLQFSGNTMLSGTIPPSLCSLNGTCIGNIITVTCEDATYGISFDCSGSLCGCDCPCEKQ